MNKPVPVPSPPPTTLDDVMRRLDRIDDNLNICVDQGRSNGQAIGRLEDRVDGLESRQRTNSDRVRHESSANMQQDAAIAGLVTKVADVDGKVDAIHKAVVGTVLPFFGNPAVKLVWKAVVVIAATYLAGKGIKVLP